jgi:methionine-rich copper-binding protein CopC
MFSQKIAVFALLLILASAGSAFAHAHLASAVPQPDGTVATAPATVTINFTEALEAKLSSIRVDDASGAEVDSGDVHINPQDNKQLIVGLKPLPPGTYKVTWKATATDTHKTNGTYKFTVAP